jgi:hypothetical protein
MRRAMPTRRAGFRLTVRQEAMDFGLCAGSRDGAEKSSSGLRRLASDTAEVAIICLA